MRRLIITLGLVFALVFGLSTPAMAWRWRGPTFHVSWPRYKHEENSLRGVKEAHRRHDVRIDIDLSASLERHIYANHWEHPMLRDGFRDPQHLINAHRPFSRLHDAEIHRLVAGHRPFAVYHIQRIERMLAECAKYGLVALLEPKGDPLFDQVSTWEYLLKVADAVGCHIEVYALPQNASALPAAKKAGIEHVWEIHP